MTLVTENQYSKQIIKTFVEILKLLALLYLASFSSAREENTSIRTAISARRGRPFKQKSMSNIRRILRHAGRKRLLDPNERVP